MTSDFICISLLISIHISSSNSLVSNCLDFSFICVLQFGYFFTSFEVLLSFLLHLSVHNHVRFDLRNQKI